MSTIMTEKKHSIIREKYTIICWKYSIFYLKVYDPQKFWFFMQKTETIRSLGRKANDHEGVKYTIFQLNDRISSAKWSYSFKIYGSYTYRKMIVYFQF